MAAYGDDGTLNATQIKNVAGYVLSLSGRSLPGADVNAGKKVFMDDAGCNACHGDDGKGGATPGAPNLTDNIWLFGGSANDVINTITHGRAGEMPSWEKRLSKAQIKAVAICIYNRNCGRQ
jgi:cytochrome c oxidase cbb3-type subunit 3